MLEKHYYEDGDTFLKVNDRIFLVHKLILSLCSEVFKNKIASTNSSIIEIDGETPESIESMLTYIYPNTIVSITWDNVSDFLRISTKFKIEVLRRRCNLFLLQNFQYEPLLAIKLAEEYSLSDAYKESSKLILDEFQVYFSNPKFKFLSEKTKLRLYESWFDYFKNYKN
jgi:hypothetical protein